MLQEFHIASLTDSSTSTIKDSITRLVNGVTLLVATAPALANVMEEGGHHINFDRCCHLVYEDADALIQEHPTALKRINVMYNKSVQRTESGSNSEIFVPRQVGLEIIADCSLIEFSFSFSFVFHFSNNSLQRLLF